MDLLIIGNSVSLKSNDDASTYPTLLEQGLGGEIKIIEVIRAGDTICDLETDAILSLERFSPRFMILQVGHVDCAPRPLKRKERDRLSKLHPIWLRNRLIHYIHKFRPNIIRLRGLIQFSHLDEFQECTRRIINFATLINCFTFILPITKVSMRQEIREPWYNREIERYNVVLRDFSSKRVIFIEQEDLFADLIPEDYCLAPEDLHLRDFAHKRIADYLEREIREKLAANSTLFVHSHQKKRK